jgi:hypothetical protein
MKASQTRIKDSIAEKGVTIDVGAGLLAKTVFQATKIQPRYTDPPKRSDKK